MKSSSLDFPGERTNFTAPSLTTVFVLSETVDLTTLFTRRPCSSMYSSVFSLTSPGTFMARIHEGACLSTLVIVFVAVTFEILFTRRPASSVYSSINSWSGFTILLSEPCKVILTLLKLLPSSSLKSSSSEDPPSSGLPHSNSLSSFPLSPPLGLAKLNSCAFLF